MDPQPLIGLVLHDTYRLERLIGEGGMGSVYEASHLRLRRRFAIKLLSPGVATNTEALARFRREGEITSELGHPNIVEVIDFNFTPEGAPYIVMELLTGENLSERIQRGPLTLQQAVAILRQAVSALEAAHQRGIVHRDLKPQNIFLCPRPDGEVAKVVDFGISKVLGSQSMMTGAHSILGTPSYMSPEQAQGRAAEVDVRTDVFALGAILYEMLSGRPPFVGETLSSVLYQVVHEPPPPLHLLRSVPPSVEQVVLRAMSKRPEDRYDNVAALAQALSAALAVPWQPAANAEPAPAVATVTAPDDATVAPLTPPPASVVVVPEAGATMATPTQAGAPLAAMQRSTLSASVGELHDDRTSDLAPALRTRRVGIVAAIGLGAALIASGVTYLGLRAGLSRPDARVLLSARPDAHPVRPPSPDARAVVRTPSPDAARPDRAVVAVKGEPGHKGGSKKHGPVVKGSTHEPKVTPSGEGTLGVIITPEAPGVVPPVAEIYLDGQRVDETPMPRRKVSAGRYVVMVRRSGYKDQTQRVTIVSGKHATLRFKLRQD
jgi:eukaryotic-like serine/threonine-protein kinase